MTQSLEILIIGAGATGLLLAQGLKRHGIKATVFERETAETYHDRPREWGMSLHWGNEAIETVLPQELRERMNEACCNPYFYRELALNNYAGHSGQLLFSIPMPKGATRVSRSKIKKLFGEGIDVQYGKRLTSITENNNSVIAHFEDGTLATGTLLIGCDGGKSIVRQLLVGPEKALNTSLDFNLFNFPCKFDIETATKMKDMHPVFFNAHHKDGTMFWISAQDVTDPEDPSTWLWQVMFFWVGSPRREDFEDQASRTAFLKGKGAEYAEPWKSVLEAVPEDLKFDVDHISIWEPIDWSSSPLAGRLTLAGDAAHPMPPYRGQGLNNGLQDAALLVEKLSKVDSEAQGLVTVLRSYEEEMRDRAVKEIALSTKAADLAHKFDQLMESPVVKMGVRKQ